MGEATNWQRQTRFIPRWSSPNVGRQRGHSSMAEIKPLPLRRSWMSASMVLHPNKGPSSATIACHKSQFQREIIPLGGGRTWRARGMSALGRKQTYAVQQAMSALHPKADMCSAVADVCSGPKADIAPYEARLPRRATSLNHAHPDQSPPLKFADDLVLLAHFAQRELAVPRDNDHVSPRLNRDHAVVLLGNNR